MGREKSIGLSGKGVAGKRPGGKPANCNGCS